jgi:transitional endoplasmic reticulum ATPase
MKLYSYALTLCNNLLERVSTETNLNSPTSQNQFNETNVSNYVGMPQGLSLDKELNAGLDNQEKVNPILRLWILRLLIPLECHRKFIRKSDFNNDEIAGLFGLQVGFDEEDNDDDIDWILECALNSDDPDFSKNQLDPLFDPKQALNQLKRCHKEAEQNAAKGALPQPLAGNIQLLAKQVGLTEVECAILAFAVMIHTDRLLNAVANWLGRELNPLDVYHILSVLLGYPEAEIRAALSMHSTLTRTALVILDRHRLSDLKDMLDLLSSGFANKIVSESGSPIDWLRDMVLESPMPHLGLVDYPHLKDTLDFLQPYLQQVLRTKKKDVNVFLYGTPGTGKTQLAKVLAQQLACPLYEIASEDDDGDPVEGAQRLRAFRTAQFFQNSPTVMLFDEVEDVFNDGDGLFGRKSTAQTLKAWMNRLLEENPAPTFWLGNSINSVDPAFIRRFDWVIELPIPPKAEREHIIRESCANVLTDKDIKQLAVCEDLAPAVVTRAAQVIGSLSGQFPIERLSTALQQIEDKTLVAQGHPGLNQDNAVRLPAYYDTALINCDTDLSQIVDGIKRNGSARLCLFGMPGTGKTAYARWLAEQLDRPLHVNRGSDLMSTWVGGTEKNIARIFKKAEEDKAVLLIDEVDSFLQDRSNSLHSWEVTAVNEMLTRMETYNGVFIASTNRMDGLDPASLRRFDLKVKFDALKLQQAWTLLNSYCLALGLNAPDSNLKSALHKLDGLTPGDFAALERQHRFRPISNVNALITALQAECALKTPHKKAIGFT